MRALRSLALLIAVSAQPAFGQAVTPNLQRGFDPEKSFAVSANDTINTFNGNLNVPVPLGPVFPVGGRLSYQFMLHYGGNAWESESDIIYEDSNHDGELEPHKYGWTFPSRKDNAGMGWRLTFGRLWDGEQSGCSTYSGSLAYEDPDGSVHCFYGTARDGQPDSNANEFFSRDGSYLRLQKAVSLATVEFPDGLRRDFNLTTGHASKGGAVKI